MPINRKGRKERKQTRMEPNRHELGTARSIFVVALSPRYQIELSKGKSGDFILSLGKDR